MRKKLIAGALAAALTITPALAAFPDVTDPQVREAAEVLRQLEVVNGKPGGLFDPAGTFTRGEFCKMALTVLDRAGERQLYTGRVIFSDVTAAHWALGWINAAAVVREGTTPLVRGKGDGRFCPDDAITCGEAVTILMRCLDYTDADVGSNGGAWYAGALLRARTIGLMDGLEDLDGGDVLTRAQAALLFENLLYTSPKDSKEIFLSTVLGGAVQDSQLVLEVKGKALSAGGWAVKTDKGSFVTLRDDLDPALQGRMCKPVVDKEGSVLALQVDPDYTVSPVRIRSAEARYVITEDGGQLLVNAAVPVWRSDKDKLSYAEAYKEIIPGTTALFCYDKTDTLISIYFTGDSASAVTAVAKEGSRPFDGAWEGTPKAVYKNGSKATMADVRPYDVGTYDPRTGVLELSDRKLTGVYENAVPSPVSPDTITMMGCEGIEVLDCALADLARFKLGDRVTLLLDRSNRVAGVVSPTKAEGKALGTAEITIEQEPYDTGKRDENNEPIYKIYYTYTAKITTTHGLTLKGKTSLGDQSVQAAPGRLWQVTSTKAGTLDLTSVSSSAVAGDWDVKRMMLGQVPVSPLAAVYERVEDGQMVEVGLDAVTADKVPSGKIAMVHLNDAGTVDTLVLRDVTGDAYTYGLLRHESIGRGNDRRTIVTFANGGSDAGFSALGAYDRGSDVFMGLALGIPRLDFLAGTSTVTPVASMPLTAHKNVPRSAFGPDSVTIDGVVWPLAADIDSCCYNAGAETWFKSLDAALSYSATLTVYCDRTPGEGGKARIVAAE